MQLNGKMIRGIRDVRTFWISFIAIVFGLGFIGLGIYFFISDQGKTYETATAEIVEIVYETIGEQENNSVIINFTDKTGVNHSHISFNSYNSSWKVGDQIEIKYNVDNPEEVISNAPTFIMPLIAIILGGISFFVGIYSCIRTIKSIKRNKEVSSKTSKNIATNSINQDESKNNNNSKSSTVTNISNTKLFFHPSGKMRQSFSVEDKNGETLFECKLVKFNPLGASLYDFIDSKTGNSKQLKIGKTVTSSSSGGMIFVGDTLSSSFKIDGVNCWDYVSGIGYEIKHLLLEKRIYYYEITKNDKVVANIVPANAKDPFNENSKNILRMGKGYYRLEINNANLEDIVMIAFIISKTDIVE